MEPPTPDDVKPIGDGVGGGPSRVRRMRRLGRRLVYEEKAKRQGFKSKAEQKAFKIRKKTTEERTCCTYSDCGRAVRKGQKYCGHHRWGCLDCGEFVEGHEPPKCCFACRLANDYRF